MDIRDCWRKGKQIAAWVNPNRAADPMVCIQGNKAALESLADILLRLSKSAPGERITLDSMTGLNQGDVALCLEHSATLAAPTKRDLMDTRVTVPDEGDTILWARVPTDKTEQAIRLLVSEAGYTSLQAREAISASRICMIRLPGDTAVRVKESLRRSEVDAMLFELRS
ncbi:MAG: hypothetical protein HYY16_04035 [Planctomycetes bacterium]|nr:hypothetical protein [Planctomycetota bacterium]